MKTYTIIKSEGMDALFDYTKWQNDLFQDETIESLGNKSYEYARSQE